MHNDIKKICVSEEKIQEMVQRLRKEITEKYADREPLFVGLLNGCHPFMSDLLKNVDLYCTIAYMKVSSYNGTESTGKLSVDYDLSVDVYQKDVILVDDILDTGRTLSEVSRQLKEKGANSVRLCVLLDKPDRRTLPIHADFVGGKVPNEFVVGYGLDYNEKYRNLPYIGVLKEEIYSK